MSYAGSGTETPVLGLPDDTFSEEDRETADAWSESWESWDYSDSDHFGGTRADRRAAVSEDIGIALEYVTDPVGSAIPWWTKYAVGGVGLLAVLVALRPYASIGAGVVS